MNTRDVRCAPTFVRSVQALGTPRPPHGPGSHPPTAGRTLLTAGGSEPDQGGLPLAAAGRAAPSGWPHRALGWWLVLAWLTPALLWAATPKLDDVFKPEKFAEMDAAITNAIADKKMPGAVLWVERNGVAYHKAYGQRALTPKIEAMTEDTIFDAASLTKVLATTPTLMLLYEQGLVKLDAPVHEYFKEFTRYGKENLTLRHLLTHTSGLRSGLGTRPIGYHSTLAVACEEKPTDPPETIFRYSDINFIVLGEVVRRVSQYSLEDFAQSEVYTPLKMKDTGYLPPANKVKRIAPTTGRGADQLRGKVHDPTARNMGGVAGHAGVFTTAADLARFARMMLKLGELDGVRILKPETVKLMTSVQTPENLVARRGLGWDIDTGYNRRGKVFPIGSYGHTGFTGTSLWIDPFSKTFIIFLSNRVHPDGGGNVLALQTLLGTLAAEAVKDFDFSNVAGALPPRTNEVAGSRTTGPKLPPPGVLNGIDVLVKQNFAPLKNLKVGLITNHSGRDRDGRPTLDLLTNAPDVTLAALFSPEHGIRGELDEQVKDGRDAQTGLPIYSLYGERRRPTAEQLAGLDALVFDIQDIGCRFYTYITTMAWCMEAAAQAKIKFFVLDRVNPINGVSVEGPLYHGEPRFTSFHPIPLRYGLTLGELAQLFKADRHLEVDLTVIPLEGWSRSMWFDQTRLPWVNPSPNMRSLLAATVYPGVGLLETAVSVGRGTPTPFEWIGAPYIDEAKLAAELNGARLPGVRFEPVRFTPEASVFKGQPCYGVAFRLTDRDRLQAVDLGLTLALVLHRLYPDDFALDKLQPLLQHKATVEAIRSDATLEEIKKTWADELKDFAKRREAFLLYK